MTPEIKVHRPARFALPAALLLAASSSLSAQTVNWDGNGDANASGDWSTGANWAGDVAPSTTAITAGLVNVSSGTRTISINNGDTVTAKQLAFTQSTAGATNLLSIASGGTLNLGGGQTWVAPTAGTSRVDLGGEVNFTGFISTSVTVDTGLTFSNAGAVFRASSTNGGPTFNFNGLVNVNAGAGTAQIAYTGGNRAISANFGATSNFAINSGTLEVATTSYNSGANAVSLSLAGATTIASGAGLKLTTDSGSSANGGNAGVTLTNSGTLAQAGTITVNARGSGGASPLTNSNTWKVSGMSAAIVKNTNLGSPDPTFTNTSAGSFTGATANDRIAYNHIESAGTNLAFTNSGIIAAGNGSNGSGLTSVGTLTLVDFAVTNTTDSTLAFDIGGTSAGQFDVLAFESGSIDFSNAKLAITLVNDFAPGASFDLEIFTADIGTSVSGSFSEITVNGVADANYSFAYVDGVGTLSYSAVPEPSTYAALAGLATLGLALVRRRGSKASL